jgi:hypothetical protein
MNQNKTNDFLHKMKINVINIVTTQNVNILVKIVLYSLIVIILVFTGIYVSNTLKKDKNNCSKIEKLYPTNPKISSINTANDNSKFKLRDYYIKTAYNCCSAGKYKNDYVNVCALKNTIKRGARCLDFAIYSVKNKPVISISNINDYTTKGSYNSLDFSEAMEIVKDYAFSGGTCPNPTDPLMLNFRIMSNNKIIYDEMAKILYNTLQSKMLDKMYSYEYNKENLGSVELLQLLDKVIISVDKSNPLFEQTKLNEYVNIASNTEFFRSYTYSQLKTIQDYNELIEHNRKNMTFIKPDLNISPKNPSSAFAMSNGCQFTAIAYQNNDTFCQLYEKVFDDAGCAFVLKPENLRFIQVVENTPPPQNPNYDPTPTCKSQPGAEFCI